MLIFIDPEAQKQTKDIGEMRKTRHWKLFRGRMLLEATMGCRYWRWHHWGCRLSNLSCSSHAVAPLRWSMPPGYPQAVTSFPHIPLGLLHPHKAQRAGSSHTKDLEPRMSCCCMVENNLATHRFFYHLYVFDDHHFYDYHGDHDEMFSPFTEYIDCNVSDNGHCF